LKKNANIILGIIQIVLSIYWIYHIALLFYYYHFTDILFAFMYPDWVLFINIILSLINLYYGIKLTMNKVSMKKSYSLMGASIFIGIIVNNFYNLI